MVTFLIIRWYPGESGSIVDDGDPDEDRCCRKQVAERSVMIQSPRLIKCKQNIQSGMLSEDRYNERLHSERYEGIAKGSKRDIMRVERSCENDKRI